MARLLTQVEPETRVKVTKIEGAGESDLKATLQDLGIAEGVELTSLASGPINARVSPISLKVVGKAYELGRTGEQQEQTYYR